MADEPAGTTTTTSNNGDNGDKSRRRESRGSRRENSFVDRFVRYRADGDPWRATEMLLKDNRGYRETFRAERKKGRITVENAMMQREIEDLDAENKRLSEQLADGIVLKGDDRKEYEAFKKLNIKAADAATRLELASTLERDKKQRDGFKNVKKAADKYGLDAELLDELIRDKSLELVHHENDAGKRVWALRKAGDDKATPVRVATFIEKEYGEKKLRALEARDDDDDEFGDDGEPAEDRDGHVETDDDDVDDADDSDDDEDERPRSRERSRSRDREDRTERRGVRIPASRGRQGPQSRGARGTSETVRRNTRDKYVPPSMRNADGSVRSGSATDK